MISLLLGLALGADTVHFEASDWDHARLVDHDGPRLVLFDSQGARWMDLETGETLEQLAGVRDLVVADVDGDGTPERVHCRADGVLIAGATPRFLVPEPCRALARVEADRSLLIAITDRPRRWGLGIGGPVDLGSFGDPLPDGPVRVISAGDSIAVRHGEGLELWGPFGQRTLTATVPDGAARIAEGWVWTAGGILHGAPGAWFDGAVGVVSVDLDADGHAEPAVMHPGASMVGWLEQGTERALSLNFEPRALLVGDVDGDGGKDLLVVGADRFLVVPAEGPPPAPQLASLRRAPAPTRPFLGVPVPLFQATEGSLASGRTPPQRAIVGGLGVMLGGTVGGGVGLGASPAGTITYDATTRFGHGWMGFDSAPLFIQLTDDGAAVHILNASGGLDAGNPHLRAGPYLTLGGGGAGGGIRVLFLPLETRSGVLHGLEWRAAATQALDTSFGSSPVGHVLLSWSTSIPVGGDASFDASIPGVVARSADQRPTAVGICRRFGITLGATAGASSVGSAWDFVGRRVPFDITATPSGSAWCESGARAHDLFLSVDSAPWFRYRVPIDNGAADIQLRHMGALSAGYHVGGDAVRVGPYVTAGVWALGGGARLALTPLRLGRAGNHGIEARALFLWPSSDAFEGWLGYTTWFDPRR